MSHGKISRFGSPRQPSHQGNHGPGDQNLPSRRFSLPPGYYELYGIRPPEPPPVSLQMRRLGLNQGSSIPRGLLEYYGITPPAADDGFASPVPQKKGEVPAGPTQAGGPEVLPGNAMVPPAQARPASIQAKSSKPSAPKSEAEQMHEAAAHGTSGPGGTLPYLDQIQPSFGKHDVRHVMAHMDSQAATSARAMEAEAFTTGEHVAFARSPNLHTAAHEAAHVVQQRAGVQLKGGVGEVGDRYEQHADAVADLVVQGKSSEVLLDAFASPETNAPNRGTGHQAQRQAASPTAEASPQSTNSPPPPPSELDALLAAVEQAIQGETTGQTPAGKRSHTKPNQETIKTRQDAVKALTAWCRGHLPDRKQLDAYLAASGDSKAQKVQAIGQLVVSVARMEFLLGWMYEGGLAPGRNWENQGQDKGEYVTFYQQQAGTSKSGGSHWCTSFAGYCYTRLGLDETLGRNQVLASGYRLRLWATEGKNNNGKQITDDDKLLFKLEEAAFIDRGEWRELVKGLRAQAAAKHKMKGSPKGAEANPSTTLSEAETTPASITDAFFSMHPAPQPGDIVVLGKDNDFKEKAASHTVLVERYDAATHTLWTIEGNASNAVRARQLNLYNPDHASQIVFLARPGLEQYAAGPTEAAALPGQEIAQQDTSRADGAEAPNASSTALLASMQDVIAKLTKLASDHQWIKSANAEASTLEWLTGAKSDKTGGAAIGTQ